MDEAAVVVAKDIGIAVGAAGDPLRRERMRGRRVRQRRPLGPVGRTQLPLLQLLDQWVHGCSGQDSEVRSRIVTHAAGFSNGKPAVRAIDDRHGPYPTSDIAKKRAAV